MRGKVGGKGGKEEMEVVSAMSQLGITVKARFVGAMRKGICNFPPLVCIAVYNSYPSLLTLGFLLHFDFFILSFFFVNVHFILPYSPTSSARFCKRSCGLFEASS